MSKDVDQAAPADSSDEIREPEAGVDSRKRFARRRWRRRLHAWRWALVLLLLIALLSAGIWALYFSSWLSVRGVKVDAPENYVSEAQVETYADVPQGGPLATLDLAAIRTKVEANLPPLKTVDVSRSWPDQVLIRVTERTPVAVVDIDGQLRALDEEGVVFLRLEKEIPGLPQVSSPAGTDAEALRGAAEVAAALPANLGNRVDHVEVLTADSISLRLADGREVVWGSASDSETKAEVLVALLKANPKAPGYDVSVPGQPVVTP